MPTYKAVIKFAPSALGTPDYLGEISIVDYGPTQATIGAGDCDVLYDGASAGGERYHWRRALARAGALYSHQTSPRDALIALAAFVWREHYTPPNMRFERENYLLSLFRLARDGAEFKALESEQETCQP